MPPLSIIAAITRNRGLGFRGELLFRIPDDLKRFKELTLGCPVIMGRKTYESIGRALPGRINIIISHKDDLLIDGCVVVPSLEAAISKAREHNPREIFVIGGGQVYEAALPKATHLYLTCIDAEKKADTFFPDYTAFTKETFREERISPEGIAYSWINLERA